MMLRLLLWLARWTEGAEYQAAYWACTKTCKDRSFVGAPYRLLKVEALQWANAWAREHGFTLDDAKLDLATALCLLRR